MTVVADKRDVAAERAEIDAQIEGRTLLNAFADTVERLGDQESIKWKQDGVWQALTWREYRQAVAEASLGLISLGFEPGQFAVLLAGNNRHPAVLEEVQRAVDSANTHLARVEQVKRFRLLPSEWTAQTGELTPTLKRRRSVILNRYAAEIEALYT